MARNKRLTEQDYQRLAEYDIANPDTPAVKAGEVLGFHRDTICDMRKSDRYQQHFTRLLHEQFYGLRQLALQVMEKKMREGYYKAAEYILDNTGFKEADKVEVTNNEIVVTIE